MKFRYKGDNTTQFATRVTLKGTKRDGEKAKVHLEGGKWYDTKEIFVRRPIDGAVVEIPVDEELLLQELVKHEKVVEFEKKPKKEDKE